MRKVSLLILGLVLLIFPAPAHFLSAEEPAPPKFYDLSKHAPVPPPTASATVKEIIALNILQLDTGESVRLLGIEPSRKVEVRRKGIEFLLTEVKGKKISLKYDKKPNDNVGRLLAYVYLIDKSGAPAADPIQEDLIWRGYVYSSAKYPCKKLNRFRLYEKAAKKEKRGTWEGM